MHTQAAQVSEGSKKTSVLWPDSTVPDSHQEILERFFTLIDSETEEGARAFGELFAVDGHFVQGRVEFHGRQG